MRRASFIAPLLLIAVGLLLLLRNIYPELPVGTFFGRYWPFILVGWGALRLAELAMWRTQNRPLPSSGITGGEWIMAIVIGIFGVGFHSAQGFANSFPGTIRFDGVELFGDRHEFPVDAEHAAAAVPHIVFEDLRGDVKISGIETTGSGTVKITGQKSVRSMSLQDAEKVNDQTRLEITGDAANLVVRGREPREFGPRVSYSLNVTVPKGATVEVRWRSGDITVEKILGGATVSSNSGDMRVENVGGPVQIDIKRADVHVNAAKVPGTLSVGSGEISAENLAGPVKFSARSYDVKARAINGPLDIELMRGDVELQANPAMTAAHVRTRSGDIALSLPASAQFSLDASTARGDASNDFGGGLRQEANGRQGSIRGSVGKGPQITLETSRGDVSVRKLDGVAMPTLPASPTPPVPPAAPSPRTPRLEKVEQ